MSDLIIGAKPIRQPDERGLVEALRITVVIFGLATPFFLYMGLSASHVQEEYRLSRLVESRHQLSKEHERLLLTRDALLSPGAVNAIAREKLGMVEEDAQEWTVGVAPEKERAGEPASRGAGDAKEKTGAKVGEKPEVAVKASAKAPASGRVTDAVARPKTAGGPEKVSSNRKAPKTAPAKSRTAKAANAKAKKGKAP